MERERLSGNLRCRPRQPAALARLRLGVLFAHVVQHRAKALHDQEQVRHAQRNFVSSSQHVILHFATP